MEKPLIVFDMDGVLVDVSESYREAIVQTVRHFTGAEITRAQIQEYKIRAASTTIGNSRITSSPSMASAPNSRE